MKTLLLLIFSSITLATQAQTSVYHPFPDSNAMWNESFGGWWPYNEYYSTIISGDTIVNSVTYHKLIVPSIYIVGDTSSTPPVQRPGYVGCFRQDTSLRRVYFISPDSSSENIMFDFSLQVGGTIKGGYRTFGNFTCAGPDDTISAIDSILIGNNYRKRWIVGVYPGPSIIEGIGYDSGLREICGCGIDAPCFHLSCFEQNSVTLYTYLSSNCNLITETTNISSSNISPILFPNPATNYLTITTNTPSEIILYDIASRKLMEQKFIKEVALNISHLAKGVYLYQVTDERGMITRGKVIKE